MDRRDFLRLSGLVTIPVAVPLLSSCASKPAAIKADPTKAASSSAAAPGSAAPGGSLQSLVNANSGRIEEVINAQAETLASGNRVAFGLVNANKPITGAKVTVYIGQDADKPPVATAPATWVQGEMAARALYVAELAFPQAGDWLLGVSATLPDGTVLGGGASIAVLDKSTSPVAGQPAISVKTPTVGDPAGADPLCSDSPPCPMHALSLDAALKNGKPTVLTFSAPAYCETELCGPVVRLIKNALPAYADRYNFVHVEAYDKDDVKTLVQPAKEWKLTSEPFTFFIDAKGIVKDRLPGAFGEAELAKRLQALES